MSAADCFTAWLLEQLDRDDDVGHVARIAWCAEVSGCGPEPVAAIFLSAGDRDGIRGVELAIAEWAVAA